MIKNWIKIDRNKMQHESGRATITMTGARDPKRRKRFVVRIDGEWIYEHKTGGAIKPFWTLQAALDAVNKKLEDQP